MNINRIKINTGLLKNDAQAIAGAVGVVRGLITDLEECFNVLDSMWDGDANEAFKKEYNSDIEALRIVVKNIEVFNRFEFSAREKYDSCEQSVDSLIESMRW